MDKPETDCRNVTWRNHRHGLSFATALRLWEEGTGRKSRSECQWAGSVEGIDVLRRTQSGLVGPDGARRAVRDRRDRGARRPPEILQECAAHHPGALALHRRLRRARLPGLWRRADDLRRGPSPGRVGRQLDAEPRRKAGRPGGRRHAQLSGVDAGLLGRREYRRRRGRHERLVDRHRDELRPQRRQAEGAVRRRRAHRPSGRTARHAGRRGAGRRSRRQRAGRIDGLGRGRGVWRRAARCERRSRRRRLHFLHVRHDRLPEGRAADPSGLCLQSVQHGVLRSGPGAGDLARHQCADRSERAGADPGDPDHHAAVPRHRQQLRRLHRHRGRREDGADVPLGRHRGSGADPARAGERRQRRAGDGPRTGHSPGLRQVRYVEPADGRRRRGAAAARPGGEDRLDGRHRPAQHRLRHDRDLRDHHCGGRRLLRRQASELRSCHADLRGPHRRRGGRGPGPRPAGRAVGQGRLRDQGLHQPPRRDRRVDHRRLAAHRRRGLFGRGSVHLPGRPQEGHGPARRREHLLRRGRGGAAPARRRRRVQRVRRGRRPAGRRSGRRDRHAAGPGRFRGRSARALRRADREAQDPPATSGSSTRRCPATPAASSCAANCATA